MRAPSPLSTYMGGGRGPRSPPARAGQGGGPAENRAEEIGTGPSGNSPHQAGGKTAAPDPWRNVWCVLGVFKDNINTQLALGRCEERKRNHTVGLPEVHFVFAFFFWATMSLPRKKKNTYFNKCHPEVSATRREKCGEEHKRGTERGCPLNKSRSGSFGAALCMTMASADYAHHSRVQGHSLTQCRLYIDNHSCFLCLYGRNGVNNTNGSNPYKNGFQLDFNTIALWASSTD